MKQLLESIRWDAFGVTAVIFAMVAVVHFGFMRQIKRRIARRASELSKAGRLVAACNEASDLTAQVHMAELGDASAALKVPVKLAYLKELQPSVSSNAAVLSALRQLTGATAKRLAARPNGHATADSFRLTQDAVAASNEIQAQLERMLASSPSGG